MVLLLVCCVVLLFVGSHGQTRVSVGGIWQKWDGSFVGLQDVENGLADLVKVNGEDLLVFYDVEKVARTELETYKVAILYPWEGMNFTARKVMIPLRFAMLGEDEEGKKEMICAKLYYKTRSCDNVVEFVELGMDCQPEGVEMVVRLQQPGQYKLNVFVQDSIARQPRLQSRNRTFHVNYPFVETRVMNKDFVSRETTAECITTTSSSSFPFERVFILGSEKNKEKAFGFDRIVQDPRYKSLAGITEFVPERRVTTEEELKQLVQENVISEDQMESLFEKDMVVHGVRLTVGGLGCALSHLGMWKRVVQLDRPVLILEDDVYLTSVFHENKLRFLDLPQNLSIAYLGIHPNMNAIEPFDETFRKVLGNNYGTFAYILTPRGARQLLDHVSFPLQCQIDHAIVNLTSSNSNFVALVANPPLLDEMKTLRPSKIQKY